MGQPGAKLRIEQPTMNPMSIRVWLNDMDISSALFSLSLRWDNESVTEAVMTIGIRELEVNTQTLINLIGTMRDHALLEETIRALKRAKAELADGLPER